MESSLHNLSSSLHNIVKPAFTNITLLSSVFRLLNLYLKFALSQRYNNLSLWHSSSALPYPQSIHTPTELARPLQGRANIYVPIYVNVGTPMVANG